MDLGPYLMRLALVLPLLCLLIVALLWLARRHLALPVPGATPAPEPGVRVSGWATLGAGHRLAIIEFAGRRLLVGVGRAGLVLLADVARPGLATGPGDRPAVGAGCAGPAPDDPAATAAAACRPAAVAASPIAPGRAAGPGFAALLARSLARHDA